MKRKLDHRFVDDMPEVLEAGILYVSMRYATAMHLCCCGCGREVVTPLSPAQWRLTFDGDSVSLHPSIGSWSLPCRSHYVISHGRVLGASSWSEEDVAHGQEHDRRRRTAYFRPLQLTVAEDDIVVPARKGWLERIVDLFQRRT